MKVKSLSLVRLLATPWTAAYQTPLSLGLSRQEHWSGLTFPPPMRESEVVQLCPALSYPMDAAHQAPLSMGFSRHEYRINAKSQAFRNLMKSISSNENFLLFNECLFVSDSLRPVDCSSPNSTVQEISQQEYWSELPFPTPGDLPDPIIKPGSLVSPALAGGFFTTCYLGSSLNASI